MQAVSESARDFIRTEDRRYGDVRKGYTHFADGDVLLAKITPCFENGKAAIAKGLRNGIGCGTTELHVLRPSKAICPEYLYHFVHQESFRHSAVPHMTGTAGQLRLPISYIEDVNLPIPPRDEQRRIVAKLEELLGNVDACKKRLDRILPVLKRFRKSVLAAACSGGLTSAGDGEGFPQGWQTAKIGALFRIATGGTPNRKNSRYFEGGKIPWVRTADVQNGDIREVEGRITEKALRETNAKIFPPNTLLIAMYGEGRTRGQIARLRISAATNQACAALISEKMDETTRQYVFYCLLGNYHQLRAEAVGGNQPNLSLGIIREWTVSMPPPKDREEIVHRIGSILKLADQIEARYNVAKASVNQLTQSILAKAFRGELVPQDPKDEPAEQMLARTAAQFSAEAEKPPIRRNEKRRIAI